MDKFIKIIKKIKIRSLIFLIFLLILNTYAWFVYSTRVSSGISAHVSAWNVQFIAGGGTETNDVIIEVSNVYPGMTTFKKDIDVYNKGDSSAVLSYEIEELRVMDQVYRVGENITKQQLENLLVNEYPFKIYVSKLNFGEIQGNPNAGRFTVNVGWAYESGDDAKDTLWGNRAYEFKKQNPNKSSIEAKIKLIAEQTGA